MKLPLVNGKYPIERTISKGGQAVVCLSRDAALDKSLAIKCYNLANNFAKESSEIEAKILSLYKHPCIPRLYDIAKHDNINFIIMDYVKGRTLKDIIDNKDISNPIIEDCIEKVGMILKYCHTNSDLQIIYGDLKPENIIKSEDGRWVLVDFGSSILISNKNGQSRRMGSPGFAAPEVVSGGTVTPSSDVYSLAALLFYLKYSETYSPDKSNNLDSAMKKALELEPRNRYQTIDDFLYGLKEKNNKKDYNLRCRACGYVYDAKNSICPRCQTNQEETQKVNIRWELPESNFNITPIANTSIFNSLQNQDYVASKWIQFRKTAEKISEVKGFDKLITVNSLNIELYPHQMDAVKRFLNNFHCSGILSDEVGLGKTIEAGVIISELYARGLIRSVLIVAPSHLVSQWREEMEEKINLQFAIYGNEDVRNAKFVIAPFNRFRIRNNRDYFINKNFDFVIVDEAHNLVTKTGVSTAWNIANEMKKKYAALITATPIKRKISDLYYLVSIVKPGEFSNFYDFQNRYINPYNSSSVRNASQLKTILNNIIIRNKRETCSESWPSKISHCYVVESSKKNEKLLDIFEKRKGELIIVFTSVRSTQVEVYNSLVNSNLKRKIFLLNGSREQKNTILRQFKNSIGGILIADKTSSEGRNLQFCSNVINYDIPADPIEIEQRIGRVYRIGQRNDVKIYNIASKRTLEEYLIDFYDKYLELFSVWKGEIYDVIGDLEDNETIPIVSSRLWSTSSSVEDFKVKWNKYIQKIISKKNEEDKNEEEKNEILDLLLG